jgi:hypothetical protein
MDLDMNIQNLFDRYNHKYFGGALSKYRVIVSDRYGSHGMCRRKQREIHISYGLKGLLLRRTLVHEMAHANSNGGHGNSWLNEMRRLAELGAPTKQDIRMYTRKETITTGHDGLIGMMEDAGFEIADANKWKDLRLSEGYSYGLVDKNGRAESPNARRLLYKMKLAFFRGVRNRQSMERMRSIGKAAA